MLKLKNFRILKKISYFFNSFINQSVLPLHQQKIKLQAEIILAQNKLDRGQVKISICAKDLIEHANAMKNNLPYLKISFFIYYEIFFMSQKIKKMIRC